MTLKASAFEVNQILINVAYNQLRQYFFQVNIALMCYLRLCSECYIVVHVELVNFLRLWQQLEQQCVVLGRNGVLN